MSTPTNHWITQYLGRPWVARQHDCWAFLRIVLREQFAIDVPAIDVDAKNPREIRQAFLGYEYSPTWCRVVKPKNADAILLGRNKKISHVGLFVDAQYQGILHCQSGLGVVFSKINLLPQQGWNQLGVYRHHSRC